MEEGDEVENLYAEDGEEHYDPEDEVNEIEEKSSDMKAPSRAYSPPPSNYIRIEYGENESIILNNNCRKKIFVDYVKKKVGEQEGQLDFVDLEGELVGIRKLHTNDYVKSLFQQTEVYIPCYVTVDVTGILSSVEPCLVDWYDQYPNLQEGIESAIASEKKAAAEAALEMKRAQEREKAAAEREELKAKEKPKAATTPGKEKGK